MIGSLLKLKNHFSQKSYSKFIISRSPIQKFSFYLHNQTTVSQLLTRLKKQFKINPNNKLLVNSNFDQTLIGYHIVPQAEKATQQISNQLFIPMLFSGDFFIYQGINNRIQICYGIQCQQFNQTNNRNLPQRLANAIIDLNTQWMAARTVADAINTAFRIDSNDQQAIAQREEIQISLNKSILNLVEISKFAGDYYSRSPLRIFTLRILYLMSINWVFLFSVTYAKYGWDVGQPISYLTSLGVDLAAMIGLFDISQKLEQKIAEQQGRWWGAMNLDAQKRNQGWLLSYYRRNYG